MGARRALVALTFFLVLGGATAVGCKRQPPGAEVFVNQLGYPPEAPKTFVSARPARRFVVIDEKSKKKVFQGTLVAVEDATSRRRVWRGDFTGLKAPGEYRVVVSGVGESYPFAISPSIYNELLVLATRVLYLQRCGVELKDEETGLFHPPCHVADGVLARADECYPAGKAIAARGGWHDAGDYGKYTRTTTVTVAQMLTAFELWPEKFRDGQLRIPESGNGIPDILDEAKVGLSWLLYMQRPDGAVYHKLSGASWPPFTGPEMDGQPRYVYGISTADTAKFAATMAIAARVFRDYDPAFAAKTRKAALAAWGFLRRHGWYWDHSDFDDNGSGAYATHDDASDRLWAALELTALGEEVLSSSELRTQIETSSPSTVGWENAVLLGLFHLARASGLEAGLREAATEKVVALAERYLAAARQSGYGYTIGFAEFAWASNKEALARGGAMLLADALRPKRAYREIALAQLDFVLGKNPLSKCFVTGVGSDPVRSPHHRFAAASGKVVPGLLVGGPNNRAESGIEEAGRGPFSYQDAQASYSSNEPAIDYNAALIFVAAAFAGR
ncbi:MAG: glycoside hydrolase family 9 protein [Bacillota bacterium]